nr:ribonuclease H-like domain-containing protein [Tanacetum cinerariifolium]
MAGEDTNQSSLPPIASPEASQMMSSIKLSILKKGEYILWTMKMEQYPTHTDYSLWEVILNDNGKVQMTKDEAGNEVELPPITVQQILARTRERKAKSTLLMAIPDEHLARFHEIKDAKTLWTAIKTRFGGNAESKKMQKNVLKQQLEIFSTLPSVWSNISLIIRNKPGIDNLDIDDLYNNLKVYEANIKGSFRSSSNSQNVAFVSAESTSSTNELNIAYSVSTATGHSSQAQGSSSYADELMFLFFSTQSSSPQLDNEDLKQIDQDDLEEMDLKWQVEMLSMRVKDYRTTKNPRNRGRDAGNAGYRGRDNGNRPAREKDEKALVVQDALGTYDWSYQLEDEATNFALMDFTSNPLSYSSSNSEFNEKEVLDVKEEEVTETVFDSRLSDEENSLANDRFKREKPKEVRTSAPLIQEWDTDSVNDNVFRPKHIPAKINFVNASESVKFVKFVKHVKPVKPVKTAKQTKKSKNFSSSPKVDRTNWNRKMTQKLRIDSGFTMKACFVCGSMSHLIKDYTFHEDKMVKKSVLPNNVG